MVSVKVSVVGIGIYLSQQHSRLGYVACGGAGCVGREDGIELLDIIYLTSIKERMSHA